MNQPDEWKGLKLETPTTYRIRAQGHLDASWSDRLGGWLRIERLKGDYDMADLEELDILLMKTPSDVDSQFYI